jgi:mono/diheme cytochrome c family protein
MRSTFPKVLVMSLGFLACSDPERGLPVAYRDLVVPADRLQSSEARERGRVLFLEHCALCHGERGDGRGRRREGLEGRPADFTSEHWRRRMSPRLVYHAIREGVRGTPMPSWKVLEPEQTWDLVAYVLSLRSGE